MLVGSKTPPKAVVRPVLRPEYWSSQGAILPSCLGERFVRVRCLAFSPCRAGSAVHVVQDRLDLPDGLESICEVDAILLIAILPCPLPAPCGRSIPPIGRNLISKQQEIYLVAEGGQEIVPLSVPAEVEVGALFFVLTAQGLVTGGK
ncbi:MAG: hypothetical protein Q9220_001669 [cf. Caloplaca sp. 1 TL-2023]